MVWYVSTVLMVGLAILFFVARPFLVILVVLVVMPVLFLLVVFIVVPVIIVLVILVVLMVIMDMPNLFPHSYILIVDQAVIK